MITTPIEKHLTSEFHRSLLSLFMIVTSALGPTQWVGPLAVEEQENAVF